MKRIQHLRNKVLAGTCLSEEFHYLFFKEYFRLNDLPEEERYAASYEYAYSKLTPSISDGELIVGKRDIPIGEAAQKEWENMYRSMAVDRCKKAGGGQASHMAIDYESLLSSGINGVIAKIDALLQDCDGEKIPFYRCCKRCLQAVVKHSENYAALARKLSQETADPVRQAELGEIARICKKVPAQPAESFYEAVQSVHFITHCLSMDPLRMGAQQFQLGHPDRYLWPYYARDIQNGSLTKERAQLLLDCLGIQINMRVPNGLSSGYMVGGRNEQGQLVQNELTELCMQVVDDIRLVYPSVGLCYGEGMDPRYLEKACSLLLKGHSHPAIFNDDVIAKGLMHYGVPESQAHSYIHSTCVEITPVAASNVWVASPYTNLPQILLDCMDREYASLEELIRRYFGELDQSIQMNFEAYQKQRVIRRENSMYPLLSCFVNDCLARGTDIERGGAVYNWTLPSFVGMANLVDAIYAIKTLVFEERKLTMGQFKKILDEDFAGNEALRQYILNSIPKYGNDNEDVDSWFDRIARHIVGECEKYRGFYTNSQLIPSVFCWVMHARFGTQTGATPDGRKSGFPLGDGSGPCQGREMNGPTASILSSTKWDHSKFIGGVAVNLKFSKASLGRDSLQTVCALVKTYLMRGGFEVQINVVDNETLQKAKKDPDAYRDLVVRIGGYSDYFVKLSPEMQEEVILRTAHQV